MKRLAVLVASAALVTLTPATASAVRAAPLHRLRAGLAVNWAGYAALGGPFTSVSTTWTEPSISCPSSGRSALASFAGLDGDGSNTVEQIGSFATCGRGVARHKGFFEMYPQSAVKIAKPLHAGDSLTASVVASGSNFTLTLVNHTAGWTFTTHQQSSGARLASAEAITEAPQGGGGRVLPLASFGQINYSGSTANGQALGNLHPDAVTMVTNNGTVKAAPGGISGGSFSVFWHHS